MCRASLRQTNCGVAALIVFLGGALSAASEPDLIAFTQEPGKVLVTVNGKPLATYVFEDKDILRPYFANVRAPGGVGAG